MFDTGEENCLPYLPEEWTCSMPGRNEEIDILHFDDSEEKLSGTLNLLKRPGLKTWKIECFFSHPLKPEFANVKRSESWLPSQWVEFFESAMYKRKILEMTVTGIDLVTYVTVESFDYTKRAGEELDTYYTIQLKEYRFEEIKKEEINITQNWVGNDTTGYTDGGQPQKADIGANAWIQGTAWRNALLNSKGYIELLNPLTTKENGQYINFNMMPVQIIERKTFPLVLEPSLLPLGGKVLGQLDATKIAITINKNVDGMSYEQSLEEANNLLNYVRAYTFSKYGNGSDYISLSMRNDITKEALCYVYYGSIIDNTDVMKKRNLLKLNYGRKKEINLNIAKVKFLLPYWNGGKYYDMSSDNTYSNSVAKKEMVEQGEIVWVIDKSEGKEIHLTNLTGESFTQNVVERTSYEQYYKKN